MNEIARRIQSAIERLLENEALTADLDDEAARQLLAWGSAWAQMIVESTAGLDDESAEAASRPRLKATGRMMRTVNRWAGNRATMDAAADRVLLGKVHDWAAAAALTPGASDPNPAGDEARQQFLARAAAMKGDAAALVSGLRTETEIALGLAQDTQGEEDA